VTTQVLSPSFAQRLRAFLALTKPRVVSLIVFTAGLIGLFLYGWMRRKEKPPPGVKPLKDEDDWK
jgi:heme O synthase-like polyprenyltransferase